MPCGQFTSWQSPSISGIATSASIWDKIWNTGLFQESFYKGELARYKKELLPYGVPLDSREKYTKSDWLVWAASLSDDPQDFALLVHSLWSAYNTMRTWAPMTDWEISLGKELGVRWARLG